MHKSLPNDDRQSALQAWLALCTDLSTISAFESGSFDFIDALTRGHGLASTISEYSASSISSI